MSWDTPEEKQDCPYCEFGEPCTFCGDRGVVHQSELDEENEFQKADFERE